MAYEGFKKLKGMFEKNPKIENPGALAGSIARKKYKEEDLVKHQQNGTSMEHVKPKKKFG